MAGNLVAYASIIAAKVVEIGRPKLKIFLKYAAVELSPPMPTEIPAIKAEITKLMKDGKSGAWKNLTVRQAWLNTLVGIEVACWFYVGEIIGKRHIIGYDVQ